MKRRTYKSQIRDLAIYLSVAAGMLLGIWALVEYERGSGAPENPARINWLFFGFTTVVVYINAVNDAGRFRRARRFWSGLGVALLAQILFGAAAVWVAPKIHVYVWAVLAMLNMAVLDNFLSWWLGARSRRRGAASGPTRVSGPLRQGE